MTNEWDKLSTTSLLKQILRTHNLASFLHRSEQITEPGTLEEYLKSLCNERDLKASRVIREANIDRTYGHQIFNGTRCPSRGKALQIAFAMGLDLKETQRLLRLADRSALYPKLRRDAVIVYCLNEKMTLRETQELLQSLDMTVLGDEENHGA